MVDVLSRRKRRRQTASSGLGAALEYAALGWPVCRGARPAQDNGRACACDRLGCPDPGAHPMSAAWAMEATTDPARITRWWNATPDANIILPTGRVFDVFDVPAGAGIMALARMDRAGVAAGPVAAVEARRYLFFVATRSPVDEDEWWSCHLDCVPETVEETPGLRWHCRDSYVPAPPSRLPSGGQVAWIRSPVADGAAIALPDPIPVLDVLADACEEFTA
ncbi:bifunctional DNA primase/polymerase [Marinactinospora thermotolerans]|uniref:Bifunctional DNA primase/polymerase, N-terminal n=1 Tax=Marinactinospora thermotolerans DSM 45154 TaxID=1122192 RepID=A0A1T4N1S5_9ACTN|nr:bifunctional DNA primase/polymerase [Marinactinospora thermotolerans]SJZ73243.1 Bifunctional DNA primase/polymerase, N-terminal [Marinactinospora thermotolerans DSM 45154]